ncbi:hypothetical protein NUSPORA_01117 [Nucleospora cyclopteri]
MHLSKLIFSYKRIINKTAFSHCNSDLIPYNKKIFDNSPKNELNIYTENSIEIYLYFKKEPNESQNIELSVILYHFKYNRTEMIVLEKKQYSIHELLSNPVAVINDEMKSVTTFYTPEEKSEYFNFILKKNIKNNEITKISNNEAVTNYLQKYSNFISKFKKEVNSDKFKKEINIKEAVKRFKEVLKTNI